MRRKLLGRVVYFNGREGTIKDALGYTYHVDISCISTRWPLKRNQLVRFEINPNVEGCRCAWKVEAA